MADRSDDSFAAELLGTDVLVGVTMVDHAGRVMERRQFHGQVIRASAEDGVTLVDAEGSEHWLPLDPEAYEPAEPGECLRVSRKIWRCRSAVSPGVGNLRQEHSGEEERKEGRYHCGSASTVPAGNAGRVRGCTTEVEAKGRSLEVGVESQTNPRTACNAQGSKIEPLVIRREEGAAVTG